MQLTPRTITLSAAWLLATAIGFFVGRQTGGADDTASPDAGASGPPTSFSRSANAGENRSAKPAKNKASKNQGKV